MKVFHLFLLLLFGFLVLEGKSGVNEVKSLGHKQNGMLRVMSFNIRLGIANDGPNRWDLRKELVVKTIQKFKPDLLGLQEVFPMQENYLRDSLPEYEYYGRSRLVNPDDGEACSVMFKKDRFSMIEKSTFWLSENQYRPGSKSWDSSLPRIVNEVCLLDKVNQKKKIHFFNTHFDHKGKIAREKSAKIIKNKINKMNDDFRVVITGDFNSREDSTPYQTLVGGKLVDTFRHTHPVRTNEESTMTSWNGRLIGNRIDWILCCTTFNVLKGSIDRTHDNGRYPSDHYPVTSILEFK